MNYKEYLTKVKEIEKNRENSLSETKSIINNIVVGIQTLMQRPHWEKKYKTELLGSFIDWWDKYLEDMKTFRGEADAIFK